MDDARSSIGIARISNADAEPNMRVACWVFAPSSPVKWQILALAELFFETGFDKFGEIPVLKGRVSPKPPSDLSDLNTIGCPLNTSKRFGAPTPFARITSHRCYGPQCRCKVSVTPSATV